MNVTKRKYIVIKVGSYVKVIVTYQEDGIVKTHPVWLRPDEWEEIEAKGYFI